MIKDPKEIFLNNNLIIIEMLKSYKKFLICLLNGRFQHSSNIAIHTLFSLITIFSANIITYVLSQILGVHELYIERRANLSYSFTWFHLLLAVCIFPILEELTFRLGLSLKRNHVLISFSMIYAFFISVTVLYLFEDDIENHFLIFLAISLFTFFKSLAMLSVPILNRAPMSKLLSKFFQSNYKIVYFGSAFLFGVFHLFFQSLYLESPFAVSSLLFFSYFISGLVFNVGRVSIGLLYVIVLHMGINLMAFL